MRTLLILSLFFVFSTQVFAHIIYQTSSMGEADVRIAIVHDIEFADAAVLRVSSVGMAGNNPVLWYITRDRRHATKLVYFTSLGMANCRIVFVDSLSEVGIRNANGRRCLR